MSFYVYGATRIFARLTTLSIYTAIFSGLVSISDRRVALCRRRATVSACAAASTIQPHTLLKRAAAIEDDNSGL